MNAFFLLLLGATLQSAQSEGGSRQPATFPEVVKRLETDSKTPVEDLIKTALKFIKEGNAPRLAEEHAFVIALANRHTKAPQFRKELEAVLEALKLKYKDETHALPLGTLAEREHQIAQRQALSRVLNLEAQIYRDCLSDPKKEREVLLQAEQLQEALVVEQFLSQLALYIKLGESHSGVIDPVSGTEKKAREYFMKAIELEFPARPSASGRYGEYQKLYTQAAIRLVEKANKEELKNLRFHAFAFRDLARLYPDRVELINGENPWVAAFNVKLERWLEFTSKELPKDSPMRLHFKGVLDYLRKDRPD